MLGAVAEPRRTFVHGQSGHTAYAVAPSASNIAAAIVNRANIRLLLVSVPFTSLWNAARPHATICSRYRCKSGVYST